MADEDLPVEPPPPPPATLAEELVAAPVLFKTLFYYKIEEVGAVID